MYAKVLSQWAMDLLELRRTGAIVPSSRRGDPDLVCPRPFSLDSAGTCQAATRWAFGRPESLLRWQPSRRAA